MAVDLTKLATRIEGFGEALRERISDMRERGETDTELFRLLVHVFGQLGAIVNVMIALGEIDPETGEKIKEKLTPELKRIGG